MSTILYKISAYIKCVKDKLIDWSQIPESGLTEISGRPLSAVFVKSTERKDANEIYPVSWYLCT